EVAEPDRTDVDAVGIGGGRQDAHALLDHRVEQRQAFQLTQRRYRAAERCIKLLDQRRGDGRVLREQEQGPRQRVGGGQGGGDEEYGGLPDQLRVCHAHAGIVVGRDQPRQHIVARGAGGPALLDEGANLLFEGGGGGK